MRLAVQIQSVQRESRQALQVHGTLYGHFAGVLAGVGAPHALVLGVFRKPAAGL